MYKKRDRVVTPDGLGHVVHACGNPNPLASYDIAVKVSGKPVILKTDDVRPATTRDFKKGKAEIYKRTDGKWDYRIIQKNGNILASSKQGYANRVDMVDVLNNNFIDFEIVEK